MRPRAPYLNAINDGALLNCVQCLPRQGAATSTSLSLTTGAPHAPQSIGFALHSIALRPRKVSRRQLPNFLRSASVVAADWGRSHCPARQGEWGVLHVEPE